jgi:hypothetical protein
MVAAMVRDVMMARVMMTRMVMAGMMSAVVPAAVMAAAVSAATAREHLSCHQAHYSHREHEPNFAIHIEYLSQQIHLN